MEIDETLTRLEADLWWAITFWSVYRDRSRLLELVETTWWTRSGPDLLTLDAPALGAATAFFERLDALELWLATTEAMPATAEAHVVQARERLDVLGKAALDALGGVPEPAPLPG